MFPANLFPRQLTTMYPGPAVVYEIRVVRRTAQLRHRVTWAFIADPRDVGPTDIQQSRQHGRIPKKCWANTLSVIFRDLLGATPLTI